MSKHSHTCEDDTCPCVIPHAMSDHEETEHGMDMVAETLSEATSELRAIRALAWAAEALLLHNSDLTVSPVELESRVAELVRVILTKAEALSDSIDQAEMEQRSKRG